MLWNHRLAGLEVNGKRARARIEKLTKEASGYAYSTTGWVVDRTIETRADFVLGTDGIHSVVRRALDIDFMEMGERQFFGVFEFNAEIESASEVKVVLDDDTTNVLWPMRDRHFRWSFQLDDSWEFVPQTRTKEDGVAAREDAADWVRQRCGRILPCVPASGGDLEQALRQIGLEIA